jgi:hypothetical protein
MMSRIGKLLSSVAEFIGRYWPASQDEDKLLEELGAVYGANGEFGDSVSEQRS